MIESVLILLHSADASCSLGRLDYASLTQQSLMEMFIDGITNRQVISGSKESPKDIDQWKGVYLNENGEVFKIDCQRFQLNGTLSFEWLPLTVTIACFTSNNLSGTVNFEQLNDTLEVAELNMNAFNGTICLTHLPSVLNTLFLNYNQFNGTADLTRLPKSLELLSLARNQLVGSLDLTQLPPSIRFVNLSDNAFVGETDFGVLPDSLTMIYFSDNVELSGEIQRTKGLRIIARNTKVVVLSEKF